MEQKADRRTSNEKKRPIAIRKVVAIIVLGIVLLASLLALGYFGVKTLHRSRQRHEAMTAYEKGDYEKAERLLRQYVKKDQNSEPEFVALANIYHSFGNTGRESQMWQTASSLNPLNREYRENMLTSAANSANYSTLHGILGRKVKVGETLTGRELYLYVIASCRAAYLKDAEEAYKKAVKDDPEAFKQSDLGHMAEFLVNFGTLSEGERGDYLNEARKSEDAMVRFEALFTLMNLANLAAPEESNDEEVESLLKEIVETNYYAGTPLLADFYYSKCRFSDAIDVTEPYLKKIDSINMDILYAESCFFTGKLDELKALTRKLQGQTGSLRLLAGYCEVLTAFLENDEAKLAANVRKSGKIVSSPLSRFIRLRVAREQNSFNELLAVTEELFSYPPFHDLHNRALLICLEYLADEIEKPENLNDLSRIAALAKVLSGYLHNNRLLTVIILYDQYKKGLVKEEDLLAALEQFPDDLILNQITAEYLIFRGKAEQALDLLEQVLANAADDRKLNFLYMLALDQLGRHDEAEKIFLQLVEQSEFDLNLLAEYFKFCREYKRTNDLSAMADKLESASDAKLKPFADFFRAAALLSEDGDDEEKTREALKRLAASQVDNPKFVFYAANKLGEADMLDEAEAKYKAIQNTYSNPALILVNLSEIYKAKGETEKALDTAKEAFDMEKKSMLPAFIYAKRLSEAERYEDAVSILNFPRRAVNYREDIVELWADCMKKVIEKSMADRRFLQAEEQCKHLLVIVPDDEFGREKLEKIRENLLPKKDNGAESEESAGIPAA